MRFRELTDEQWVFMKPLLPPPAKTGRPRADDRRIINAILYVLKTGIPWNDLPSVYGDDVTAWRRLRDWERRGVWRKIVESLLNDGYASGRMKMESVAIDSTTIPAKKGGRSSAIMLTRSSRGARSMQQ